MSINNYNEYLRRTSTKSLNSQISYEFYLHSINVRGDVDLESVREMIHDRISSKMEEIIDEVESYFGDNFGIHYQESDLIIEDEYYLDLLKFNLL